MSVPLSELLNESSIKARNSTTGRLDNEKRTVAINHVLEDLQDFADWEFTKRDKEFYFIDGVSEYSLENYVGATCLDSDGTSTIPDFKNARDLYINSLAHKPFDLLSEKEVRDSIRRGRSSNQYAVDNDLLIINYARKTSAEVHNMDSLTANGTWAATGDATNLTVDSVEYEEGSGSLNFDTTAGTSLVLSNTTMNALDLSTLQNKSHFIVRVYLPTITAFSSITLRWGNDLTTNYWQRAATVPAGNRELKVGWNVFAFRWADATETGSPSATTIDSFRITIAYSSATTDTDFRVDDLRVGQETKMTLNYFSLAMVKTAAGLYQLEFDSDDVTQTDELLGGVIAKKTVISGAAHELFEIIGGKSERDRTDSFTKYETQKVLLKKKAGYRIRRPAKSLNFPSRH